MVEWGLFQTECSPALFIISCASLGSINCGMHSTGKCNKLSTPGHVRRRSVTVVDRKPQAASDKSEDDARTLGHLDIGQRAMAPRVRTHYADSN